jgi:sugar phosphate isomerase/epimerase
VSEVAEALEGLNLPIVSVHANRDIGNYLCSEQDEKVRKGVKLADECMGFAEKMGAKICVFHLWDTWNEKLNLARLEAFCREIQQRHPMIEMSVENVPTKHAGKTPFQIMSDFRFRTLDLKWASLFGEFDSFLGALKRVDNVHVQGRFEGGRLAPTVGSLDYEQAVARIRQCGYAGVFTVELEGNADYRDMVSYVGRLKDRVG